MHDFSKSIQQPGKWETHLALPSKRLKDEIIEPTAQVYLTRKLLTEDIIPFVAANLKYITPKFCLVNL